MKKRYIYRPGHWLNDQYVVEEFFSMMDKLAAVHRCPVRLVKTKQVFGYHLAVYELCPETKGVNNENK